jgi:lipoprotein-anchoring transpeptidase ErfK/SrfK
MVKSIPVVGPLHAVFNDTTNRFKLWEDRGEEPARQLMDVEGRNDTVRLGWLRWGACPRGEFRIGSPIRTDSAAFGAWFIPVLDRGAGGPMKRFGRSGIGVHGGGTGLPNPFARGQGWRKTHGCIRLQNYELEEVVRWIQRAQAAGFPTILTVAGKAYFEK